MFLRTQLEKNVLIDSQRRVLLKPYTIVLFSFQFSSLLPQLYPVRLFLRQKAAHVRDLNMINSCGFQFLSV